MLRQRNERGACADDSDRQHDAGGMIDMGGEYCRREHTSNMMMLCVYERGERG